MNIKGVWKGYYQYGLGYDPPYFGEKVEIYMTILGENANFEGFCIEEASPFAIQEPSNIKGYIEDGAVSFVKNYENRYEINEAGESVVKEAGEKMEVIYEGMYNGEYDCIYGSWQIETEPFEYDGEVFQYVCQGTWKLEREEEA